MKKINLKQIMKNAWVNAANAASIHGGKKSEYFAECLKLEWAFHKKINHPAEKKQRAERIEKTVNEIQGLKKWFVRKNFSQNEAYVIETNDWIEVLEETAKAYRLRIHNTDFGNITTWAPKSCCVA